MCYVSLQRLNTLVHEGDTFPLCFSTARRHGGQGHVCVPVLAGDWSVEEHELIETATAL